MSTGMRSSSAVWWLAFAIGIGAFVGLLGAFGVDGLNEALSEHNPAQR